MIMIRSCRRCLVGCLVTLLAIVPSFASEYFVDSQWGNDANDGRSPETAWKSLEKVNGASLDGKDVIRFRRGRIWRGTLMPHSGTGGRPVTYAAYGEGQKPIIQQSLDRSRADDWISVGTGLWSTRPESPIALDVGLFVVDHGKRWGVKKWNADHWRPPRILRYRQSEKITDELDFWYDSNGKRVVVKCAENPGSTFDSIELALTQDIVMEHGKHDVVYDGLWLRYGAAHGVGGGSVSNIVVRNCDICWIGGGLQRWQKERKTGRLLYPVRFGNGVEFWSDCRNCLVENCRIWEVYDSALTNQGKNSEQADIIYRNNVIWNCENSFEYWNSGVTRNVQFIHNTCVDAGCGWGHGQRPNPNASHVLFFPYRPKEAHVVVRDNVFCNSVNWSMRCDFDWRGGVVLDRNLVYNSNPDVPIMRWLDGDKVKLLDWHSHQALGFDVNGLLARPDFCDAKKRDYRLRRDSPGWALSSDGGCVGVRH